MNDSRNPQRALLCAAVMLVLASAQAQADCRPVGTGRADDIQCSATTLRAVLARGGNDRVTVAPGARVDLTVPATRNSGAAIDAGTGDDVVTNDGIVSLTTSTPSASSTNASTAQGITTASVPAATKGARAPAHDERVQARHPRNEHAHAGRGHDVHGHGGRPSHHHPKPDHDHVSTATAGLVGIVGGEGNDRIVNRGTLTVTNDLSAIGTAATNPAQCRANPGDAHRSSDGSAARATACPTSTVVSATGITGDAGNDELRNEGVVAVTARITSDSTTRALETRAVGLDGGVGSDVVVNTGTLTATAESTREKSPLQSATRDSGGASDAGTGGGDSVAPAIVGTVTSAAAYGLVGGSGDDVLENAGTSSATANATSALFEVKGSWFANDSTVATNAVDAAAIGLAAGDGNDRVTNSGISTSSATAEVLDAVLDVNLVAKSHATVNTLVTATSTGLDGGSGDDAILNTGKITVDAIARERAINAELDLAEAASLDASVKVTSTATGVSGGAGRDAIRNSGELTATALSEALDVDVAVSLVDVTIFESEDDSDVTNDASTQSKAIAAAIDTGDGDNAVVLGATAKTSAVATANAVGVNVSVGSLGIPGAIKEVFKGLASVDLTADATATGVLGGSGADVVGAGGTLGATATADSTQVAVNVGIATFELPLPTPGFDLIGAGTSATAAAAGIATGAGDDVVDVTGRTRAEAIADADTTTVDVNIDAGTITESLLPLSAELAAADTSVASVAQATALDGGAGLDTLTNVGTVEAVASAETGAVTVAGVVNIKFSEDDEMFAANAILARSGTTSTATATAIEGAGGDDLVANRGRLESTAGSSATGVTATFELAGTLKNTGAVASVTASDVSTTSSSTATGIAGGAGDDRLVNAGYEKVSAQADTLAVSAAVTGIIAKGDSTAGALAGVSLARAKSTSTATAIGLDGGAGVDDVVNSGEVHTDATADADAVSVSIEAGFASKGIAVGAAVVDARTFATAVSTGMQGGQPVPVLAADVAPSCAPPPAPEPTPLVNTGLLDVRARASTVAVGASIDVNIAEKGVAAGAALADATTESHATATGIGVEGAEGAINQGRVELWSEATSTAVSVGVEVAGTAKGLAAGAALAEADVVATADAIGIAGHDGDDELRNLGTVVTDHVRSDVTAVGVSAGVQVAKEGAALGAALANTDATATSSGIGVQAAGGDDLVANAGTIDLSNATAHADAITVGLSVSVGKTGLGADASVVDSDTTANARLAAADGGSGDDVLVNDATVKLTNAYADALAVSVTLGVSGVGEGAALGATLVDASGTATANLTGLDGGSGDDLVRNLGTVTLSGATADGNATSVGVKATFAKSGVAIGAALARTGTSGTAQAVGLAGGAGDDALVNEGVISVVKQADGGDAVHAESDAVTVAVTADGTSQGITFSASLVDATARANGSAIGLDGGAGDDRLVSTNAIGVDGVSAVAHATGVGVDVAGAQTGFAGGFALALTDAQAEASAAGLAGGDGDDRLAASGAITIGNVDSDTNSTAVSVSLTGTLTGVAGGAALADTSGTATTRVAALDGGRGDDRLYNESTVDLVQIRAESDATSVSVQLGLTQNGVTLGAALVDSESTANTFVAGLQGGDGNDRLVNRGAISAMGLTADAGAVSVSVAVNGTINAGIAGGAALTDTSANATLDVAGLAGGGGDDVLANAGNVSITGATSNADSVGVGVTVSGALFGAAGGASITDTRATAESHVAGLSGGAGDDRLYNEGLITTVDSATAGAVGVSVGVTAAVGVGGGAQLADTSTYAESIAAGLDGGAGRDAMWNEGGIVANSSATATATSVSLAVNLALGGDATLADARSTAVAKAAGLLDEDVTAPAPGDDGHAGDCEHEGLTLAFNEAPITATATARSTGTSIAVELRGYGLGDTTNTSTATAAGILVGGQATDVENAGGAMATGRSTATGLSVAVGLAGKNVGDASTTSTGEAIGIRTGAWDDRIVNDGYVVADAGSVAKSTAVSVTLAGVDKVDASSTANATAIGLDGGAGDDFLLNRGAIEAKAGEFGAAWNADCATVGGACAGAKSIGVGLFGTGAVDADTIANGVAVGLSGGAGDDVVGTLGEVTASAHSAIAMTGVTVELAGKGSRSATSIARSAATGLAGDAGDDHVSADAAVHAKSASHLTLTSVGVTVAGTAGSDSSLQAASSAAVLDGGVGDDELVNRFANDATANSTMQVTSTTVTLAGTANDQPTSGAITDVAGLRGGAGEDAMFNLAGLTVASNATLGVTSTSFALGGTSAAGGTLTSTSRVVGLDGGSGDDLVENRARIGATPSATFTVQGNSYTAFGTASSGGTVTGSTAAIGIDGGAGSDSLRNLGELALGGTTSMVVDASTFTLGGTGDAGGRLEAAGRAVGVAGGDGDDFVENRAKITTTPTSTLTVQRGSTAVFGAATSGGTVAGSVDVAGIAGDAGSDIVLNFGELAVGGSASVLADASTFTLGGTGSAGNSLESAARVIGIDGGAGDDVVENRAKIVTTPTSSLTVQRGSSTVFGTSSSGGAVSAGVFTAAIDGGAGDDFVRNRGELSIGGTSTVTANASSFTFGGQGGSSGALEGDVAAYGIAGGAGDDELWSDGTIGLYTSVTFDSQAGSKVGFGVSGAGTLAGTSLQAAAMSGGDDDDGLTNVGTITVSASGSLKLSSSSYTFGGTGDVTGQLSGNVSAAGLEGGAGSDRLRNDGAMWVLGTANLTSSGSVNTTFGTAATGTAVVNSANAVGLDGGAGSDQLENTAKLDVASVANSTAGASSYTFGGKTGTTTTLKSHAGVAAFRGGDGDDDVWNAGAVTATATVDATATAVSAVDTGGGSASVGTIAATLDAVGMDGGAGHDTFLNEGSLKVVGYPYAGAENSAETGFLFGDGDARESASVTGTAAAVTMGAGDDAVFNKGALAVELVGRVNAHASSDGGDIFDGDAYSNAKATLVQRATGIATGDGDDWIRNDGTLTLKTWRTWKFGPWEFEIPAGATSDAYADGDGIDGDGTADSSANTRVDATAIEAGEGDDYVRNVGSIGVDLRATADATVAADGDAKGSAVTYSTTTVEAHARGVDAGGGDDFVVNEGTLAIGAFVTQSQALATYMTTKMAVDAVGIDAGAGGDDVRNYGGIDVTIDARNTVIGGRVGADAYGIRDAELVRNDGTIGVHVAVPAPAIWMGLIEANARGVEAWQGYTGRGDLRVDVNLDASQSTGGSIVGEAYGVLTARDVQTSGFVSVRVDSKVGFTGAFAEAHAYGIVTGNSGSRIEVSGPIDVVAKASGSLLRNTSSASGIVTGGGADLVYNMGRISVAAVGARPTFGTTSVDAVGIATGAGDDIVVNDGSVIVTRTVGETTSPAIAIHTGAGDDVVTLGADSTTVGDIELGGGDDRLVVEGTPFVDGQFGTDTSRVVAAWGTESAGAQRWRGTTLTKTGFGTFAMEHHLQVAGIDVRQGTLLFHGDYAFAPDGSFSTVLNADGSYGQLRIDGRAAPAGALTVARTDGLYVNGTRYDVLVASAGLEDGAKFGTVQLPQAIGLLSFGAEYLPDRVRVTTNVASLTTKATTGAEAAVAAQLDGLMPAATGEIRYALTKLQTLQEGEYSAALTSLGPSEYGAQSAAALASVHQFTGVLQDRLTVLRLGRLVPEDGLVAQRSAHSVAARPHAADGHVDVASEMGVLYPQDEPRTDAWLKGFGQRGSVDSIGSADAFDYDMSGFTLGFDRRFTPNLTVGLGYGRAKDAADGRAGRAGADVKGEFASLYGSWFDGRWYVNGVITSGRNDYDAWRALTIGDATAGVTASYTGRVLATAAGVGRYGRVKNWWVEPFAYLHYARVHDDAFAERGADLGLAVQARTTDALLSRVGTRISRAFELRGGHVVPEVSVAWTHDYSGRTGRITAAYLGAPDAVFTMPGAARAKDGGVANIGVSFVNRAGFATSIRYATEFGGDVRSRALVGEMHWQF